MAKNLGKWIGNNEVNGDKIRAANDQFIRARNAANTNDVNLLKANSSDKAEFGAEPIYSGTPTTVNSLVNKQYLLDALAGIRDPKDAVRAATPVNLPAYTPAGTGVGKTLTADVNGALVIDGITLEADERVGILNETTHNGIYVVTQTGDVGTPWILTRSTDADQDAEVTQGMSFDVIEGTALGKTRWLLTTKDVVVDTTVLVFVNTPNPETIVQFKTEDFTLDATDISNGYVDLANLAESGSLTVYPVGGPVQDKDTDFTVSVVSDVTRITFAGDFDATLEEGDKIVVKYAHF